ncbi:uncharacterized protein VTP21DRAFT_1445 [Calcarisporiella thermophila]|uniref:uncharacterized protein n=1 Tax=Calcarisporiella thermophila TaxID=911321 RepID=UPI003743A872
MPLSYLFVHSTRLWKKISKNNLFSLSLTSSVWILFLFLYLWRRVGRTFNFYSLVFPCSPSNALIPSLPPFSCSLERSLLFSFLILFDYFTHLPR